MQVIAASPAPSFGPIGRGDKVIRAIYDDHAGAARDILAHGQVGLTRGYATLDQAIAGARLVQHVTPSKQWGDQAIAILTDPTRGFTLLELDSVLAGFEGTAPNHQWWEAQGYQAYAPEVVAVVNGFYQVIEHRGAAAS